jgi:hypothetical protein
MPPQPSFAQIVMLGLGFHAFGQGAHSQRPGQVDDGGNNGGILAVAGQFADKGAVDLDGVRGKTLEIGQAGIAGAKVVHRQPHAHGLDDGQLAGCQVGIFHQRAFGDFDFQAMAGYAAFLQGSTDIIVKSIRASWRAETFTAILGSCRPC